MNRCFTLLLFISFIAVSFAEENKRLLDEPKNHSISDLVEGENNTLESRSIGQILGVDPNNPPMNVVEGSSGTNLSSRKGPPEHGMAIIVAMMIIICIGMVVLEIIVPPIINYFR